MVLEYVSLTTPLFLISLFFFLHWSRFWILRIAWLGEKALIYYPSLINKKKKIKLSNRKTTEGKGASFYDRVVLLCFEQQRDNLRTRRLFFFNYFSSLLAAFMTLTTLFACYHSSGEAFAALLFSYPARTFELCSPTPHYTEWPRNALKDLLPVFISDIIFLVSSPLVFFFFSLSFIFTSQCFVVPEQAARAHIYIYIYLFIYFMVNEDCWPGKPKKKK